MYDDWHEKSRKIMLCFVFLSSSSQKKNINGLSKNTFQALNDTFISKLYKNTLPDGVCYSSKSSYLVRRVWWIEKMDNIWRPLMYGSQKESCVFLFPRIIEILNRAGQKVLRPMDIQGRDVATKYLHFHHWQPNSQGARDGATPTSSLTYWL